MRRFQKQKHKNFLISPGQGDENQKGLLSRLIYLQSLSLKKRLLLVELLQSRYSFQCPLPMLFLLNYILFHYLLRNKFECFFLLIFPLIHLDLLNSHYEPKKKSHPDISLKEVGCSPKY